MKRNNHLKRIILAAIFILVLFTGTSKAYAADSLVVYEGTAMDFIFVPNSTDLFQDLKDVLPGDELTQEIIVKNINDKSVRVYLRAETVESEYRDFLSKLSLSIIQDGSSRLFDAPADQQQALVNNVLLGTLYPGVDTELHVILNVPSSLGNEYQNTEGVIRWVFTVEELDDPWTPKTGDDSVTWIWYAVLSIAVVAIAVVLIFKKKKKGN